MPSVSELTSGLDGVLLAPRPGPGVCRVCFDLIEGYARCWKCVNGGHCLDVVAPISYSTSGGRLHEMLAGYKRTRGPQARRFESQLAAVLWRYLALHERCVARAASVAQFDLVTTVPSSDRDRDVDHALRRLVGQLTVPARERYYRLLRRSGTAAQSRAFDAGRFEACASLDGQTVLLVDDMWTTGASAQSAAAALKAAGASVVAAVVIGRYLNVGWHRNQVRLDAMSQPFDWRRCALEPAQALSSVERPARGIRAPHSAGDDQPGQRPVTPVPDSQPAPPSFLK